VDDQDTPPEELHYSVIRKPSNGYLTLGERPEAVASFTQYDVNHGRLHFVQQVPDHSSTLPTTSCFNCGSFSWLLMGVTDGPDGLR
jgi:hypothetical protein